MVVSFLEGRRILWTSLLTNVGTLNQLNRLQAFVLCLSYLLGISY